MPGPSKADYSTKVRFTVLIPGFGGKISLFPMTQWVFGLTKICVLQQCSEYFPRNQLASRVCSLWICGYVSSSFVHNPFMQDDITLIYPPVIHKKGRVILSYPQSYPQAYPQGKVKNCSFLVPTSVYGRGSGLSCLERPIRHISFVEPVAATSPEPKTRKIRAGYRMAIRLVSSSFPE